MRRCSHCEGFVPAQVQTCPHCEVVLTVDIPKRRGLFAKWSLGRKLTAAAAGSAMMFTMMACYGMPPCQTVDNDKDGFGVCVDGGWTLQPDCDDTNAAIFPGAKDPKGDGIDQNCDGVDGEREQSSGTP